MANVNIPERGGEGDVSWNVARGGEIEGEGGEGVFGCDSGKGMREGEGVFQFQLPCRLSAVGKDSKQFPTKQYD